MPIITCSKCGASNHLNITGTSPVDGRFRLRCRVCGQEDSCIQDEWLKQESKEIFAEALTSALPSIMPEMRKAASSDPEIASRLAVMNSLAANQAEHRALRAARFVLLEKQLSQWDTLSWDDKIAVQNTLHLRMGLTSCISEGTLHKEYLDPDERIRLSALYEKWSLLHKSDAAPALAHLRQKIKNLPVDTPDLGKRALLQSAGQLLQSFASVWDQSQQQEFNRLRESLNKTIHWRWWEFWKR